MCHLEADNSIILEHCHTLKHFHIATWGMLSNIIFHSYTKHPNQKVLVHKQNTSRLFVRLSIIKYSTCCCWHVTSKTEEREIKQRERIKTISSPPITLSERGAKWRWNVQHSAGGKCICCQFSGPVLAKTSWAADHGPWTQTTTMAPPNANASQVTNYGQPSTKKLLQSTGKLAQHSHTKSREYITHFLFNSQCICCISTPREYNHDS